MRLLAPAKINLHLRVGPPTADGFHPLLTWMVTVGLFDSLDLEHSQQGGVSLSCDVPGIPTDASNLVMRCANLLADSLRERGQRERITGVRIDLKKTIPAGAGLGGGSSDGAATLIGLNQLWNAQHSREALAALAARAGSDLSFFLLGPSSICTGRGEIVQPIAAPRARWGVLFLPQIAMPTPAVYRKFDEMRLGDVGLGKDGRIASQPQWQTWVELPASKLLPEVANDLEPAAFAICPRLGELRANIEQALGRIVRMSGSGSSLFSLYDTPEEAFAAAGKTAAKFQLRAEAVELAVNV